MTEWPVAGYTPLRVLLDDDLGRAVLARHDASTSRVVIRYLPTATVREPGFRARLRIDARLLTDLYHPAVARVLENVESCRGIAVVREHVHGRTVRALLGEEGAIGPEAALVVLDGVLRALDVAHSRGVLHRGCSPSTVSVTPEGRVALADFGIAGAAARASLVSGTPFYLAPEYGGAGEVGPQADLYAAAATCFECLAGGPPFFADDLATLRRHHERMPPPVDVVPEAVRDLLRHGLAKAPADRPAGAAALLADLQVAAMHGYGPGWAERGRAELAELVAGPRQPFRLDAGALAAAAAARSAARGFQLGLSGRLAAAAAFAVVLAVQLVAVVPSGAPARVEGVLSYGGVGIVPGFPGPSGPVPVASGREITDLPSTAPAVVPAAAGNVAPLVAKIGLPGTTTAPTTDSGPGVLAAPPPPARRFIDPSGPITRDAPRTDVIAASVRSFEQQGNVTALIVDVATNGIGPVQVLLGYGTGRPGDPGSTRLGTVTKTLAGRTGYELIDERPLPDDCSGYAVVVVATTPAAGNGSQVGELDLSSCEEEPVEAATRSDTSPPPPG